MKFLAKEQPILAFCSSSACNSPNRRGTCDDSCRPSATSYRGLVAWRQRFFCASGRDCIRPSKRAARRRRHLAWPAACRLKIVGSSRTGNRWAWRATCDRLRSRDVRRPRLCDRTRRSSLPVVRGSSWHRLVGRRASRSVDRRLDGCTGNIQSARRARTGRLPACTCRRRLSTTDNTEFSLK